ncbi:hypothetical protein GCM10009566_35000 [Streptomyces murinus]
MEAPTEPKRTWVAPVRPVPVTVTVVPPDVGPPDGERPVTTGGTAAVYVKVTVALLVPLGDVTVTGTEPALPAGVTAVIWVADETEYDDALREPKRTAVAPVRPVPVMTTVVPPDTGPCAGAMELTTGGMSTSWK